MKSSRTFLIIAAVFLSSAGVGIAAPGDSFVTASNEVWSTFGRFTAEKHALAEDLAKKHKVEIPAPVEKFFAAAQKQDWVASSNLFFEIEADQRKRDTPEAGSKYPFWGAIHDTYGTFEVFHSMNPRFAKMFGEGIVKSIPAGSIYFGGTEGGRFLVSVFSQSHSKGRPFYTITQNALADPNYLGYVVDMYGDKIHVADTNDSQKAVDDYMADFKARTIHDQTHPDEMRQIKLGEEAHLGADGKVQVAGQVSVMELNALVIKTIFDKNPTNEFYVEESFPLDWMFPHLTPSGLIMKINRAEIPQLTEDELKKDHEFWRKFCTPLIGDWITYDTSVKEVTAFAEKVVLNDNYDGFKGDRDFVLNEPAQQEFSKLRSSIAGVYTWRLGQPPSGGLVPANYLATGDNRKLIEREADFAFKQAFALAPFSPEVVFRYVQLLVNMHRTSDALAVAESAQKMNPHFASFADLIKNLKSISAQSSASGQSTEQLKADVAKLEKDNPAGSTNFQQQFVLAEKLFQLGEKDRAYQVLDRVLSNPQVTIPVVMSVAKAYNDLAESQKLQGALEALTRLAPDSPEAWYDLSASHAMLAQNAAARDCLKKALQFNAQRLVRDPKSPDIRSTLAKDARFDKLRDTPEFKAIVK